jgi:cell division septation protein DedD
MCIRDSYYVVTPYSGDPSLETAREAVPEAYVRNFDTGASVQLGAFSDPAKAEELVQQLESQGIPAEIYQP